MGLILIILLEAEVADVAAAAAFEQHRMSALALQYFSAGDERVVLERPQHPGDDPAVAEATATATTREEETEQHHPGVDQNKKDRREERQDPKALVGANWKARIEQR